MKDCTTVCGLQYALFLSASPAAHLDNSIVSSAWALLSLASMAGYAVALPQRRQHFLQAHHQVQQQQQDH